MENKQVAVEINPPKFHPFGAKEQLEYLVMQYDLTKKLIDAKEKYIANPTAENEKLMEIAMMRVSVLEDEGLQPARFQTIAEATKMTSNMAMQDAKDLEMMQQNYDLFWKTLSEHEARNSNQHIKNMLLNAQKAQTPEERLTAYKGMKMTIENLKLIK